MRPIVRPKSVVSLILVSILSTFVPLAKAELTIHTSVDKNGDTQMLVNNEAQKQLPPPQLGITPPTLHDDLVLATGKLDKSLTLYNYSTKPKKIKLSMAALSIISKFLVEGHMAFGFCLCTQSFYKINIYK